MKSKCYLCKRNFEYNEVVDNGSMSLYCFDCVKAQKIFFSTKYSLQYKQLVIYGIYRRKNNMNYDIRKKVWKRLMNGEV